MAMCLHEKKQCPRCRNDFECKVGNIAQCSCSRVQLSETQKAFIAQRYHDCLCSHCLATLANEAGFFLEKYVFQKK